MATHEVAGKGYVLTENSQFHLYISHKGAKSMAKLIIRSYGESQPAVCLSRGNGAFEEHPSTRGHLSFRNEPQKKQPGKLSVPISG